MKKLMYFIVLAAVFTAGFAAAKMTSANKSGESAEKVLDAHGHEAAAEKVLDEHGHEAAAEKVLDAHGHEAAVAEAHQENEANTVKLSPESQEAAGLKFETARLSSFKGAINATGQINNDAPDSIQVRPEGEGIVLKCGILPGETVAAGRQICMIEGKKGVFEVKSPINGIVISSFASPGTTVDKITALHIVADLSRVNAAFDVNEKDISAIRIGQRVLIKTLSSDKTEFYGKVAYISPAVDNETRTVKVGVGIENTSNRLKLGMFVKGSFEVEKQGAFIVIPQDAAQYSEGKRIAFVKTGGEEFEMRELEVSDEKQGELAVSSGIKPKEQIVTAGGFLLKSEFFKSKMGAGCAD